MRAFVFPGQGSQFVGMGREAYIDNNIVRDIFDRANDVLGYELTGIMFEGPDEELRQTENAQPAIFVHSYALFQLLGSPQPAMAAGHSLGEYTALTVANALAFDEALRLVQIRAGAMREAGRQAQGTMAAVIGLDDETIGRICRQVYEEVGVVQSANFNSPGQVVVSGTPDAVAETMRRAKEAGARMVKQLNVSGAFHSPLMEPARQKLAEALSDAPIRDADFPVYVNVSGEPVTAAGAIRESLLKQLTAPVQWTKTIERMAADGASEFIEVGPGNVLQGLVKRIAPDTTQRGVADLAMVAAFNEPGT
ncbi:MAG TPA: ACP S-malonyltransferase [Candidatus Kapabacteria bacterium]|nr:ACP S-malonyltransferase [Candidatus Kapabacteria bacterium]